MDKEMGAKPRAKGMPLIQPPSFYKCQDFSRANQVLSGEITTEIVSEIMGKSLEYAKTL